MEYEIRKPDFLVEIARPNYETTQYEVEIVASFDASPSNNALISYSFSESLDTIATQFSLSFTAEMDEANLTWMDKIELKDLVFIYEFSKLCFVGIVEDRRFSASIGGGKPSKKIVVSGVSLGNLLTSFPLVINQFIWQFPDTVETANQKLQDKLSMLWSKGQPMAEIIEIIYNSFFELVLKMSKSTEQGMGIKTILDKFIDFKGGMNKDIGAEYPITLSAYNIGVNNIWDILLGIITPPVYELFMFWNADNKTKGDQGCYEAVFRQTPFQPSDWVNLPRNTIPSVYVADYDFGVSGTEIYTYYLCTVSGSQLHSTEAMLMDGEGIAKIAVRDEKKWKKYGYRPLFVEFRYFNPDEAGDYTDTANTMRSLAEMLKGWYEHNDEFVTGSISIMTVDERNNLWRSPRIGERFAMLGGEFYIEAAEHAWNYGGPMETRLSLTRGYEYSFGGTLLRSIHGMGRKLNKFQFLQETSSKLEGTGYA